MRLAFTLALRELRGGIRDFRLFLGCLIIGVTVIAGVGIVAGRIEEGVHAQARTLLGGDVEITLTNARITPQQLQFMQGFGTVSLSASMRAMTTYKDEAALVELRGVDEAFPLLGQVELAGHGSLKQTLGNGGIAVEESLLARVGARVGDRITIGNASFVISDVIEKEPDRIASAFSLGPHVLARLGDLEKTGLLLPGSLIRYNYHIRLFDMARLDDFKAKLASAFPSASWTVKTINENNRTVQELVEKLQLFMTLAGLSSLLIGGVGILNATESYVGRKLETIATLKALGGQRNLIFTVYLIVVGVITLMGIAISLALGCVLSWIAMPYLAQFFPLGSGEVFTYAKPLLLASLFGVLTVFTFSIASLGSGVEVSPALLFRAMQTNMHRLSAGKLAANIALVVALAALVIFSASDRKIALGFIGAALLSFIIFGLAALVLKLIARSVHFARPWARLAIANLHRPGANSFSIMLSIGIGLSVLIALLQVEGNFHQEIAETIPAQAPSLFLIDIQPYQKDELIALLRSKPYLSALSYKPMIRGRISKINGVAVEKATVHSSAKWAIESDRGLSYDSIPPDNGKLTQGSWWQSNYRGQPLVSLDRKLAEGMGLKLGDTLTLNILGQDIEAQIANLREVNYASFQINFAMILSPGAIEQFPATYIATLHVTSSADENALIRELAKRYPNISTIQISHSLAQLSEVVGHIATAIRLTALTALACGMLVLASAMAATIDKRIYDIVILKVLGARRSDILKVFFTEWMILAFITALIASLIGSLGAWLILKRLDWVEFHFMGKSVLEMIALTLLFVTGTGLIIHTRILGAKASHVLRNE